MHFSCIFFITIIDVAVSVISGRVFFLRDLLNQSNKPSTIISYLSSDKSNLSCKSIIQITGRLCKSHGNTRLHEELLQNNVYLVAIRDNGMKSLLQKAQKQDTLKSPARWVLFYSGEELNNTILTNTIHEYKMEVETLLEDIYVAINTEVYVAFDIGNSIHLFLIFQVEQTQGLLWEEYGVWSEKGFDRAAPTTELSMRRKNLRGRTVVIVTVLLHNSLHDMPDYKNRHMDTLSKLVYHVSQHMVEWVNGTSYINRTDSWGYVQADGTYNGVVREFQDNRADISGSVLLPTKVRLQYIDYIIAPASIDAKFVFKKPALASITNIYALPFARGVWICLSLLILFVSFTLLLTYFREDQINPLYRHGLLQKMSDGFHDTLCVVFQQGTARDPVSVSSRQILFLGLLAFMFLYTAYSANVIALLRSATNDINSIESLLNSPLQYAFQDVPYLRNVDRNDSRPYHRALVNRIFAKEGQAFLSVEDGVKKIRQGMFAYHVELPAGYDQIQRTFLEEEKCNLGAIKFLSMKYPYIGISRISLIRDQLRVGIIRAMESGVQMRTSRRITPEPPRCGSSAAMFTAVKLLDVAPAFRYLLALYALAIIVLVLEIYVHRREKAREKLEEETTEVSESSVPQSAEGHYMEVSTHFIV